MTALRRVVRETFDPDRDFVLTRALPVAGRSFGSGEVLDKGLVTFRRLRQMYDARLIKFSELPPSRAQRVRLQRTRVRRVRLGLSRDWGVALS